MTLAEELYRALIRNGSCSCCEPRHRKPTPENKEPLSPAVKCSMCIAIERYERETKLTAGVPNANSH
jgi:hypothetical protein